PLRAHAGRHSRQDVGRGGTRAARGRRADRRGARTPPDGARRAPGASGRDSDLTPLERRDEAGPGGGLHRAPRARDISSPEESGRVRGRLDPQAADRQRHGVPDRHDLAVGRRHPTVLGGGRRGRCRAAGCRGAAVELRTARSPLRDSAYERVGSMIDVYNNDTNELIGAITEADLKVLIDHLEEESSEDQDYYIDRATLDVIGDGEATEHLMKVLRKALGTAESVEIRWQRR